MFEKIRFHHIQLDTPITHVSRDDFAPFVGECQLSQVSLSAFESTYSLAGSAQMLILHPTPARIQDSLLHIQSFAWMNMDSHYYTNRQDYASYLILYTYSGSGKLSYQGKNYTLKKNDLFFIDCRNAHEYHTYGDHWEHCILHFNGSSASCIYEEFQKNGLDVFSCTRPQTFQSLLEKTLYDYESPSAHRDFFASIDLMELLRFLIENVTVHAPKAMPDTIRYLLYYIENNYDKALSLDHLSAFSGMSKYHMSREFRQYVGYAPNDYLIKLRLMHAQELLTTTDIPAYKIGILVGIPNELNFQRLFKKHIGMPPGAFRKLNQKEE